MASAGWLERAREAGGPRREPRLGARGVVDAKLTEAGAAPPSFLQRDAVEDVYCLAAV